MAIYRLGSKIPQVPPSAYVASEAVVIGEVFLGEDASLWPGAVIRGDNVAIRIGRGTNVQEGAVLHSDPGVPLVVGDDVSIGHQAMLHGCTVGDGSLIGIQAVVMNGAVIGRQCLVGAGTLVAEGKAFNDRALILGSPARMLRTLTDEEVAGLLFNAEDYVRRQRLYKLGLERIG
ncbi:MAG TPA: gamma carbonic anhydrase family protein [Usitatibacter sp.]|jgi:carbonic anhydrase/acetyltransferase-like protein (isoleucine patch superfamily)|nr:gamma carbonic anhydrase family protein [Usitatibacter sp.]